MQCYLSLLLTISFTIHAMDTKRHALVEKVERTNAAITLCKLNPQNYYTHAQYLERYYDNIALQLQEYNTEDKIGIYQVRYNLRKDAIIAQNFRRGSLRSITTTAIKYFSSGFIDTQTTLEDHWNLCPFNIGRNNPYITCQLKQKIAKFEASMP